MADEASEHPQSEPDLSTDERISELEDLVSELNSNVNDLTERVQDLEETSTDHEEELTVLESRANHLSAGITDTEELLEQLRTDVESKTRTLQNNVKRLQSEGSSELKARVESQVSTMERVLMWGEDYVGVDESAALNRAKVIAENWEDWSSVTPSGKSIHSSSDNLKAMLSAAIDEDLQWTQVHRAAEKLASLSAGKIEYVRDDGNRVLTASKDVTWVTDEEDLVERGVITEQESVSLGPAEED